VINFRPTGFFLLAAYIRAHTIQLVLTQLRHRRV